MEKAVGGKCPACNYEAETVFDTCPKCGVILQKYYQKLNAPRPPLRKGPHTPGTDQKPNKLLGGLIAGGAGFVWGLIPAAIVFMIGLGALMIPLIGWILGPFIMLGAVCIPLFGGVFGAQTGVQYSGGLALQGACPYCTALVNVNLKEKETNTVVGVDCPTCQKRFVVKEQTFCGV